MAELPPNETRRSSGFAPATGGWVMIVGGVALTKNATYADGYVRDVSTVLLRWNLYNVLNGTGLGCRQTPVASTEPVNAGCQR